MRVWIDLANSPHVPLFVPVVRRLRVEGHEVVLTARDHAQTLPLARDAWPDVVVIGGESPPGRIRKAASIAARARALRRFAATMRPDVALSHGSYAQIVAARLARVPAVTMMDYEFQPANHVSFRLARSVIVPAVFPEAALRRFGAGAKKVVRYEGFKEELYLSQFQPDASVLQRLGVDPDAIIVVMRPPPEGALYHRMANERFDQIVAEALLSESVELVLLPRTRKQADRYGSTGTRIRIPAQAVDGRSLLALADLTIGAGGTMNRESAILGTPTYTVFVGKLAAVDAELIRTGRLKDLRDPASLPRLAKKDTGGLGSSTEPPALLDTVIAALTASRARN